MKRIITFLFILSLSFFLFSCGKEREEEKYKEQPQYQIYLLAESSGFNGSYEEWLASIKGESGKAIELVVENNVLCWHYVGDNSLIPLYDMNSLRGNDGIGISKIEKTSSDELIDTYTITFTDKSTTTFVIKNGSKGEQGENGKSAYDLAVEAGFVGTLAEWLESLKASSLENDEYIVSFCGLNNNIIDSQTIKFGHKATKPQDPDISGYTFDGWYTEDNERWVFAGYSISEDIILYAHFNPITYTINYNFVGFPNIQKNDEVVFGSYYGFFNDIDIEGYEIKRFEYDGQIIQPGIWSIANDVTIDVILTEIGDSIEISGYNSVEINKQTQLSAVAYPDNTIQEFIWSSSDTSIATVDQSGLVTGINEGQATITVSLQSNQLIFSTIVITVKPISISQITINGEQNMYVGYSQQLSIYVFPTGSSTSVTWKSSDETIATVDETGRVTGIKAGTVRIKATSTKDSKVVDNFRIKIEVEPPEPPKPDMGGYEIIIMNAESALSDNDPFLEKYTGSDKLFKQQAWREIESEYNCKITVTAYPPEAPWGNTRVNWIIERASTNQSQCDLAFVSSNWIHNFAKSSAALDVTSYYNTYGKKQMDPILKQAGSYHNRIYIASTGLTTTGVNVDLGLYYNYGLIKKLGLDDPAILFNEGRWTYTGFAEWVHTAQAKLGDGKNALGGHPYYYYYGMTNAAGVKIADVTLNETNIMSKASKNAMELMQGLTNDGCVSKLNTWGEAKSTGGEPDFFDENVLMITGLLWFPHNPSRWHPDNRLNWEGTPEFGYVPFPYPDYMKKEDTKIGVSSLNVYMFVAGRTYPAGVDAEAVYRAMNDMFLRTHRYQESDPTFNAREVVYNSLKTRIDNDASIEAIMFYDASRTMFDPAHGIYSSTAGTRLRQPSIDVMFYNKDFTETFGAVYSEYQEDFLSVYG